MPGFDGTGPDFTGPMTGGARGRCTGDRPLAGVGEGRGLGFGRGRGLRQGRGRGVWPGMGVGRFGNLPAAASDPVLGRNTDLQQLERQAAAMKQHLEALQARMESLKTNANE